MTELRRSIIHDCACETYRNPIGAVKTGQTLTLAFTDEKNDALDAELIIWRDGWEETREMCLEGRRWFCAFTVPDTPAAMWYCFRLHLASGEYWLCAEGRFGTVLSDRGEGFRLTVYDRDFTTPEWFRGSIMYQIFPDRFARDGGDAAKRGVEYHRALGRAVKYHESWDEAVDWLPNSAEGYYFPNDFYGGTLRGIEERLPYLQSLGVGVLYLNPVFEACSNHRYDTADYMRIDPILGTNEDMARLCRKAGELGIRILLDGVFSHTGADSVYFNRFSRYPSPGAYQGESSPYYPWYDFRAFPDDYRCWWNFTDLPEVNELDPAWREFIITGRNSVIRAWLRRGVSGFRLDVADELPDETLHLIRQACKEEAPDNVVLGEVWEDAVLKTSYGKRRSYALGDSLDSVMNYPLRQALIDFFTFRTDARALSAFLLEQRLNYPAPMYYALMNLVSSHDVERIRTALATRIDARQLKREQQAGFLISDNQDARGEKMQRLCAAVQYALPGVPCCYYGDETGMNGMLDPFNRAPFKDGARPLTDFYRRLGEIRRSSQVFSTGAAAFFSPSPDVLAVLRAGNGGAFLTLVNRGDQSPLLALDLWQDNAGLTGSELDAFKAAGITGGRCLLTGTEIRISDGLAALRLPAESVTIFELG